MRFLRAFHLKFRIGVIDARFSPHRVSQCRDWATGDDSAGCQHLDFQDLQVRLRGGWHPSGGRMLHDTPDVTIGDGSEDLLIQALGSAGQLSQVIDSWPDLVAKSPAVGAEVQ